MSIISQTLAVDTTMEDLLLELDLAFEARRLAFVLINGLVPFVAVTASLYLGSNSGDDSVYWLISNPIGLLGLLLCVTSIIVGALVLNCHFKITTVGTEIYRRINAEYRPSSALNWRGVSVSMYVLVVTTLLLGLLLAGWSVGFLWWKTAVLLVVAWVASLFALICVHRRAANYPAGRISRNFDLPELQADCSQAKKNHARSSLRHTYADLAAAILIGVAIYVAGLGAAGDLIQNPQKYQAFLDTPRAIEIAQSVVLGYAFLAVGLAQIMVARLRRAKEEFASTLVSSSADSNNGSRYSMGLDNFFLLHLLLGVLALSALTMTLSSLASAKLSVAGGFAYLLMAALSYVHSTREAIDTQWRRVERLT